MIVVVSTVAAAVEVVLRIVDPNAAPRGFTTLLVVVLFLGGIQLLCLSIIGAYLAGIYEEVKHRPAYIVDTVTREGREVRADRGSPLELGRGVPSNLMAVDVP